MNPGLKMVDRGFNRLKKELEKLKAQGVAVGIQGDLASKVDPKHDGMSNVVLGVIHEFGSEKVANRPPQRSFIGSTLDENQKKYEKELARITTEFFDKGLDPSGELFLLGETVRNDIIKKVKGKELQELAQSTVDARGGSDTPLWDSGHLINSIRSVVVDPLEVRGRS